MFGRHDADQPPHRFGGTVLAVCLAGQIDVFVVRGNKLQQGRVREEAGLGVGDLEEALLLVRVPLDIAEEEGDLGSGEEDFVAGLVSKKQDVRPVLVAKIFGPVHATVLGLRADEEGAASVRDRSNEQSRSISTDICMGCNKKGS